MSLSQTLPITPTTWLLALSPILVVLVLMVGFRWGGSKAGPVGWLVALVIASLFFGAGSRLLFYSQVKGLLLALYVLYIIWFALALYHVVNEAGALEVISAGVARLTADRTMQLLILSWVFASFLQGVTGFGVPIAVVGPLLIGLGFPAVTSVVATSVGHSWAVTFGSVASSFYAMMAVTGLDGPTLAPWSAIMLGLACFPCGLVPAYLHRGWSSLRHSLPAVLGVGAVMALVQYLMATNGLWNLASFVAGLVGLIVVAALAHLPMYQGTADERTANVQYVSGQTAPSRSSGQNMSLPAALSAYLVLLVLIVIAQLVPPIHALLNRIKLVVHFPETQTALGWVNAPGTYRTISVFGHAGAVLIYTCVISYFIYRRLGRYAPGAPQRIAAKTIQGSVKSTVGIVSLVGMALFMADGGMTFTLAQGVSRIVGSAFPFIAPFIGALGAFMTGSNTNSNVVFAQLQQSTAQALQLSASNVLIILGAQNVGGAIGSMFAPAKVIVGCSTAGLAGQEGEVLRLNLIYGLLIVTLTGMLTIGLVAFFKG